jgi:hypothetical protein
MRRMPARVRVVIGLIGSVIIALSSVAHSLVGWAAQRQQLEQLHAPLEVMRGVMIGWLFGGLAILVFGVITGLSFVQVLRGRTPHMRATLIIGFAYTGFGIWAWFLTREPFPLVFIVPGLLVLTGAAGHDA